MRQWDNYGTKVWEAVVTMLVAVKRTAGDACGNNLAWPARAKLIN